MQVEQRRTTHPMLRGMYSYPGQTAADGEKTVGRIICGDQSAAGYSFPMGCAGRLSVADGTPAPDRKQQHRVDRHERALRSFAPAISMMKAAEPGTGDHRRPRAWPEISGAAFRRCGTARACHVRRRYRGSRNSAGARTVEASRGAVADGAGDEVGSKGRRKGRRPRAATSQARR
jgi:hypothetical protein